MLFGVPFSLPQIYKSEFKLNVEENPKSWNVNDSLAEAYMNNGDTELAIKNYEISLKLNPDNDNGKQILKKLKKKIAN